MASIKAGNIRKGNYIEYKSRPHLVTKTDFMSPGKGSAYMRCKLKNLSSENTVEVTFKSNETVQELDISSVKMQYLYHDKDEAAFMNNRTFEQVSIPSDLLEGSLDLLTAEVDVYVMFHDGKAIGVSLPPKVKLKVESAEDAASGDTVGQAKKPVVLETGLEIQAPVFVKTGDVLIIDTATKQYISRG